MKEYNVYLPFAGVNGAKTVPNAWSWLEKLLDDHFGGHQKATARHEGGWGKSRINLKGKIRAFTVQGEEKPSRTFFRRLKKRFRDIGLSDFVIIETEASEHEGEVTGERI